MLSEPALDTVGLLDLYDAQRCLIPAWFNRPKQQLLIAAAFAGQPVRLVSLATDGNGGWLEDQGKRHWLAKSPRNVAEQFQRHPSNHTLHLPPKNLFKIERAGPRQGEKTEKTAFTSEKME